MTPATDPFRQLDVWLNKPDRGVDPEVADQVTLLIMDGLAALGGGLGKLNIRLAVLSRLMALTLGALAEADDGGDALVQAYCDSLGGAVEHEVARVRTLVAKGRRELGRGARRAG